MIVAAFLFPLALYCFALGVINRRGSPLLVPATWDFVGVLGAASGFLVLGVPAMLSSFSEHWRTVWIVGRGPSSESLEEPFEAWLFVSVGYFVAVLVIAALVIWRRRLQTEIYNVETVVFEEVLQGVFESLEVKWMRSGRRFLLERNGVSQGERNRAMQEAIRTKPSVPPQARGEASAAGFLETGGDRACVEVDLAPMLHHATLRWEPGNGALRGLVEAELERILPDVRTSDNPMGGWFLAASTVLLGMTIVAMGVLIVARLLGR